MIELKTPKEIEAMKPAGRFVGGILRDLKEFTKVGTNLLEIDEFVHKRIVDRKGASSCYVDYAPDFGTGPFAHYICTSVNDAVLHGGANEAVLRQLKAIRDSGKTVKEFVEDAKANGHRISGLGHRVYKSYDPRAAIAKTYLQKIMERTDTLKLPADERALFDVATELEQIALSDDYFVSRHLYPNVDFYTGLIYRAIGFDPSMFTTLFALGRIPGWIAQYREMLADPNTKIGRPRQVYTGYTERDYVPMDQRH